jgi:hypothetical protein
VLLRQVPKRGSSQNRGIERKTASKRFAMPVLQQAIQEEVNGPQCRQVLQQGMCLRGSPASPAVRHRKQ